MKNEWVKTNVALPNRIDLSDEIGKGVVDNNHADCFIYINGQVKERPFNFTHVCWDDRDYDDLEYEAEEPTHWMLAHQLPKPPQDT